MVDEKVSAASQVCTRADALNLAAAEKTHRKNTDNPKGYRRVTAGKLGEEHGAAIDAYQASNPNASAEQIASDVLGVTTSFDVLRDELAGVPF